MEMLSSEKLLEIWEAGLSHRPLSRAIAVLRAAGVSARDPATLPLGARDRCLLALREETFGPEINGVAHCPECGEAVEMQFTVADIRLPAADAAETLALDRDGYAVRFHLPTSEDLLSLELAGVEDDSLVLERCVSDATRDGEAITAGELPEEVREAVAETMAASDPQAQVEISLECPACGKSWLEMFDIESFFWNELQPWAARMLREIHQLASAYGWSQREILALSPLRRSVYLNLIAE
jgi:uncharacterized protein (UPF0212 family)